MSFSLLRLPEKALNEVMQNMDAIERVGFSLLSERAKQLASCKIVKRRYIHAILCHIMDDGTINLEFRTGPRAVICEWKPFKMFDTRGLIDHFMYLFKLSTLHHVTVLNYQATLSPHYKQTNFDGLKVEEVTIDEVIRINELLKKLPHVDEVSLLCADKTYISRQSLVKLQSVPYIYLCRHFTLNDLLVMNNPSIHFGETILSEKDLTLIIKHWINGWNPGLQFLNYWLDNQILPYSDPSSIMKGLSEKTLLENGQLAYIIRNIHGTTRSVQFSLSESMGYVNIRPTFPTSIN